MKYLGAVLISATILVTGCKKAKDGAAGAQGPQGPAGVQATLTDGFIKGTINGTRRDGTAFNETFNYTNYWEGPAATLDSTGIGYTFTFYRGTDISSSDYASFNVTVPTLTSTTAILNIGGFRFNKSLGTNKLFQYSIYTSPSTPVSAFSYNQSTGQLSGTYNISLTGSSNNTTNSGNISGSFQTTVTRIYYRTVNPTHANATTKQN